MSDIYKEIIIDHYNNPRNFGQLDDFTHHTKLENTSCGDKLELWLLVDDNDTVKEVKFLGEGCAISIAMMSLLSEEIVDKRISKLLEFNDKFFVEKLGLKLSKTREKCALLSVQTLKKALAQRNQKRVNNINIDQK